MNPKTKILLLLIAIIIMIVIIILILISPSFDENSPLSDEISEIKQACIDLGCPGNNNLYAGSINSDKFYYCTCSFAKNINPKNLVCFQDEAQAFSDNRTRSDC